MGQLRHSEGLASALQLRPRSLKLAHWGLAIIGLVAGLWLAIGVKPAHAGVVDPGLGTWLQFDTELTSMNLTGGPFPIPLGLGWTPVGSQVGIALASQRGGPRSLGQAIAFLGVGEQVKANGLGDPPPIDPNALDGQQFFVNSFFDVFFDITVTDVDPTASFAGQLDGASLLLPGIGPAPMQTNHGAIFDKDAPNFGLIPPPETAPYIGHFNIEIPLNANLGGGPENDKIKFTLATHSVGGENRSFIILPDGTVVDSFDSAAALDGAIVDASQDPPFTIGQIDPNTGLPDPSAFGGPTTASGHLRNEIVPEPSAFIFCASGLAAAFAAAWRRRKGA